MVNWDRIKVKLDELINVLHEELGWFNEEELENTPGRVLNFYREWYELSSRELEIRKFDNGGIRGSLREYKQLIVLKDIQLYSLCSHHLLPFYGKCHIVYFPRDKIVGVSKIARVVKKFMMKPQIQEQLTEEIADFIFKEFDCKFVFVVVEASHLCMIIRGVKEFESKMITSALRVADDVSEEESSRWRAEALNMIFK